MRSGTDNNRKSFMSHIWRVIICAIFFIAVLFLSLISNKPDNYFLQEGDKAPETIYAVKQVEDPLATETVVNQAREAVVETFQKADPISTKTISNVDKFFAECLQTRRVALDLYGRQPYDTDGYKLSDTDMETVKNGMSLHFEDEDIYALMLLSENDLLSARSVCVSKIESILKEGLRESYVDFKRDELNTYFKEDEKFPDSPEALALTDKCLKSYLRANMIYNEQKTNAAKDEAAKKVAHVVIERGQPIVSKGEEITKNHLKMLDELGLTDGAQTDYQSYAAQFVIVLGLCFMLIMHIWKFENQIMRRFSAAVMFFSIILLTLAVCLLAARAGLPVIPAYLAIMLLAVLTTPRAAMMAHIFVVLMISFTIEQLPSYYVLTAIMSGLAGTYTMSGFASRYSIIVWGTAIGTIGALLSMAAGMLTVNDISECLRLSGYSFAAAAACTVVCLGTLPLWERIFDVLTPAKLMEISNNDQPLIKSLMMEAPGTYHHSLIVANLAEQACDAIGANGLLARAAALYHDVGKLKNPLYFKENQIGVKNPHDDISPAESAAILRAHVKDGIALAIKHKAPRAIVDIVAQHHGSALMQYFHAKEAAREGAADIREYSYTGPKPQTAEAAVVMLADTVEAAVRADADISLAETEEKIKKLIHARIKDEQLSDSPLTLGNLAAVQKAFMSVFYGMNHERVEYPG